MVATTTELGFYRFACMEHIADLHRSKPSSIVDQQTTRYGTMRLDISDFFCPDSIGQAECADRWFLVAIEEPD